MGLICFLDNDIIHKLAACDLFLEAISSLNLEESDLRVLANAHNFFQNSRHFKNYPDNLRNRMIDVAQKYTKVDETCLDIDVINDLKKIQGIDPGESLLTAAALNEESFYLTTGDKRYIKALGSATQIQSIQLKLSGRVICLEQVIKQIIYCKGFENTLTKVLPGRQYDKSLGAIFGSGEKCTQDNVVTSLNGYIQDLKNSSGDLLADI